MSTHDRNPDLKPPLKEDRQLKFAVTPKEPVTNEVCLDAERLAAWLEDGLSAPEAAAVESHLAECARCQATLAAFASTESDAAAVPVQAAAVVLPFRPRRVMRWLLPAAGLAAASLAGWAIWPRPPITTPEETVLAKVSPGLQTPAPGAALTPSPNAMDRIAPASRGAGRQARTEQTANEASVREFTKAVPPQVALPLPAPLTTTGAAAAPPGASGATALPKAPPVRAVEEVSVLSGGPEMINLRAAAAKAESAAARVIVEFGPPTAPAPTVGQSFLGGNARAGGGGGGRGAQRGAGAALAADRVLPHVKWRVLASGQVAKAINGSDTWDIVTIKPTVFILNGAAPSDAVCWLVGRAGVVLLSTDGGVNFTRLIFPYVSDLRSITAVDSREATVTTADGHVYATEDGGENWKIK